MPETNEAPKRQRVCPICNDARCDNGLGGAMFLHERAFSRTELDAAVEQAVADLKRQLIAAVRAKEAYYQSESDRAHDEARRQRTSARAWMAAEIATLIESFEGKQS